MEKTNSVPMLRFPGFHNNWECKTISEITEKVNSGKTPLGGETVYVNEGVLFIRSQNVLDSELSLCNVSYIPDDVNQTMRNSEVRPNDILLNITGASLGRSCVVPKEFIIGNVNQHVCIIRIDKQNDPRFIQPIFASEKGQNFFVSLQTGSGREGLNFQSIKSIKIKIPALKEQNKIAYFFTSINNHLTQLNKKKSLLEQYKKGVMQLLFSQELRFKDEDGNDFADWEELDGNLLFDSVSDKKHNSDLPILAITQEFGAIPRELIDYNVTVTDKSVESYKVVQIGDFIISLRSFQGGIEYSNYKGICSPAYIILRPIVEIDDRFFKYFFKTEFYIKQLNRNLEGIRDGKMISFKYFSEISLPYPSLPEQTKIANFLTSLDDKIAQTALQIEKMQLWKKGLLQQMFV